MSGHSSSADNNGNGPSPEKNPGRNVVAGSCDYPEKSVIPHSRNYSPFHEFWQSFISTERSAETVYRHLHHSAKNNERVSLSAYYFS